MPKLLILDSPEIPDPVQVHSMQVAVGTLMYTLNSCPDLTHAVHQVDCFFHDPGPAHVRALDDILCYLAGRVDLCMVVGNWTPVNLRFLDCFHLNADSSHKNVELNFCGITGIGDFAFSTLLLARSFVQDQVVVSSAEDDYYASSFAVKDLGYLRLLLQDLRIFPDDTSPPTVLVGSVPAIAMSQGLTHCSHTNHIEFTKALVRDYVQSELAVLKHGSTDEQIADMRTKHNGQGFFCCLQGSFHGSCSFLAYLVLVLTSIVSSR
jgi:hypothetical protein